MSVIYYRGVSIFPPKIPETVSQNCLIDFYPIIRAVGQTQVSQVGQAQAHPQFLPLARLQLGRHPLPTLPCCPKLSREGCPRLAGRKPWQRLFY